MKKIILLSTSITLNLLSISYAQTIGINTNDPKSTLDINGKKDTSGNLLATDITGIQAPRLTRAELTSKGNTLYGTDQKGVLIYITDITGGDADAASPRVNVTATGYYYFDGAAWIKVGSGTAANDWHTTGNNDIVDGTNFLGTTNHVSLAFRVNNQPAGRITPSDGSSLSDNIFFGAGAGTSPDFAGTANVGIGYNALNANTIGANNVAIGKEALAANTSNNDNIAIGSYALRDLSGSGLDNIGIGFRAGKGITGGVMNIMIGNHSGGSNPDGNYQLNIGNAIYGTGFSSNNPALPAGKIGLLIPDPTELLDLGGFNAIGQGGLRIRNINSTGYISSVMSDKIVVADSSGVLKTMSAANIVKSSSSLSGTGNAYACINPAGQIFRSPTPCTP
ncbi:hypothetical protein ACQWU4_18020 [Chryseobacterium sp. MIQD13]|uniref:hypothetical protein n=1 Tax=Chryseobacterium sp. MIQD13 TaxID=3422310 RepID=UPI003D2AAFB6